MLTIPEIVRSVYGVWRLARFDAIGMEWLDRTDEGFWRSFRVAILLLPVELHKGIASLHLRSWFHQPDNEQGRHGALKPRHRDGRALHSLHGSGETKHRRRPGHRAGRGRVGRRGACAPGRHRADEGSPNDETQRQSDADTTAPAGSSPGSAQHAVTPDSDLNRRLDEPRVQLVCRGSTLQPSFLFHGQL